MLDFCIYLLYRAGSAIASVLPLRVCVSLRKTPGIFRVAALPKYRRLARRNLAIALRHGKTPREMRRLVRLHFQSLGANLLCSAK